MADDDAPTPDEPLEAPQDDDTPAVPPAVREVADTDTTVADEDKQEPGD